MNEKDFFEQYIYDPEKDILGSGGFGSVYRAYDRLKNRYVAVKISQVKDIFGKFTLLNEVKLSQEIDDHTNVARYEFGLRVKHPFPVDYAIMAYYEEGNLDMLLRKKQGILTPQEQYEIVEGLLEGINHLHAENVIHRDLKLANILMHRTKQGHWRPKIADFGLSRQMDAYDASMANSAIGITIAYAAPEQIENKPIRKNVDLWALGVVIYRVLTGDMPFAPNQGADPTSATVEMSRKITQVELPQRLYTISEPYQSIIKRCWVKDVKDRAQSASELLDILRNQKYTPSVTQQISTAPTLEQNTSNDEISETLLLIDDAPIDISIPPSVSNPEKIGKSEKIELNIDDVTSLDVLPSLDDTDKTTIEPNSLIPNTTSNNNRIEPFNKQLGNNKSKIFMGAAGLLCLLLGLAICNKKAEPQITPSATTQLDTSKTLILADNSQTVVPDSNNKTTTPNSSNILIQNKKDVEKTITPPTSTKTTVSSRPSGPIDKAGDFVLKLSCCCHELTGGTIRINNFLIESNGRVSTTSNTKVRIINNGKTVSEAGECQEKILSVFKKYYRWSPHGSSYYTMDEYEIDY